jgi:hypothetical protein
MWIANFVFCTMLDGCVAVTFDDQRKFATEAECELYTEQKSDLVMNTMEERGIVGAIYYACEFKGDGLKT